MEMKNSFGGTTEQEVLAFEQKLNAQLPETYRQFLIRHNGDEPSNCYLAVPGWGDSLVNFFFGIGFTDFRSLERCLRSWVDVAENSRTIPIGADPGGNIFFIGVNDTNLGRVYFLDHEQFDEAPILIADSFMEFAAKLTTSTTR
ncbi:SMI1/KNR4 family protein [Aquabacterium sp.]|uniref:SMI1/KNR4 family protein n=1 Tax=Aquabacterium sp. TaxID=1872578 RepID=UPI0025C52784|nr:SMI1/KNR4 family protein [Aquabacterium sp.]